MAQYKLTAYKNARFLKPGFSPAYARKRLTVFALCLVGSNDGFPFFSRQDARDFVKDTGSDIVMELEDTETVFMI